MTSTSSLVNNTCPDCRHLNIEVRTLLEDATSVATKIDRFALETNQLHRDIDRMIVPICKEQQNGGMIWSLKNMILNMIGQKSTIDVDFMKEPKYSSEEIKERI